MKNFIKICLTAVLVAAMFSGCRTSTLHNIEGTQFAPLNKSKVTMDNVSRAIMRAGGGLGWQMQNVSEGEIIGTLILRDHVAKVKIPYTATDYSILYVDSTNLKYDPAENTIHSNYNGWISRLNAAIQTQVNTL